MVGSPSDTRVNETVADFVCDPERSEGRAEGLAVRFSPLQLMALSTMVSAPDLDSGDASIARIFDPCAWILAVPAEYLIP